jgi:hypothetical protein
MIDVDMQSLINYKSATVAAPTGAAPPAVRSFDVADRFGSLPHLQFTLFAAVDIESSVGSLI